MSGRLPGIKLNEFQSVLKANGYKKDRCNTGHEVWEKTITDSISIPIHGKEIKGCIARKIIKEHSLKV